MVERKEKQMEQSKEKKRRIVLWGAAALLCLTVWMLSGRWAFAEGKAYEYIVPDSDSAYLTEADIAGMDAQVLCYAKNEIYARHGRQFVSKELSGYFEEQPWYYGFISAENFSSAVLNKYETANVKVLTDKEKALMPGGYVLDKAGYSYEPVYSYVYGGTLTEVSESSPYIFADSDSRYLSESEITLLSLQAICYAKNEIYARHGRMFQSQELTDYFNSKDWYVGTVRPENFSASVFNAYENANVQLLASCEKAKNAAGYQLDQPGYDIYAVSGGTTSQTWYTGSEYIFADSDTRYLTSAEVNSLSLKMACYAKNEIYARRGRLFQSSELAEYFRNKSWYYGRIQPGDFSDDVFNKYELENIRVLTEREYSLDSRGYQLS